MRHLRRLAWTLLLACALLLALGAALWFWSGSEGSLAFSLQRAAQRMPASQTLELHDVSGSVRGGGHIGLLRWNVGGLRIEAQQVHWDWQPLALIDGKLQLQRLQIGRLSVDDQRPPGASAPLAELVWPTQVESSFSLGELVLSGPVTARSSGLGGSYRFDGQQHTLHLERLLLAAGSYRASATLQARAPMALQAEVAGKVLAPMPAGMPAMALDASASLRGTLGGDAARLELRAGLQPVATTGADSARGMRATVSASISPWATQPLDSATLQLRDLDLAALWPGAPGTRASGTVRVEPAGQGWLAHGELVNTLAGPLDQQRLPVEQVRAQLGFDAGQWNLRALDASVAAGRIRATGQLGSGASPAQRGWQVQALFEQVNPAGIYGALAAASVSGSLTATTALGGIDFRARLQPAAIQPPASALSGWRLQRADLNGSWADGWLRLPSLLLQTDDALLRGQLEWQVRSRSAKGQLQLTFPGGQAEVQGAISAADGGGEFRLALADAALAQRWLQRLPQLGAGPASGALAGQLNLSGRWSGGWQQQGRALSVQAELDAPSLGWQPAGQAGTEPLRARALQGSVTGSLQALDASLQGRLEHAQRSLRFRAQAQASQAGNGDWSAHLNQFEAQARDGAQPGEWTLQLRQPLGLVWRRLAGGQTLEIEAGQASLGGPAPGNATLSWQPLSWSRIAGRSTLASSGRLQDIPLGWLELLGGVPLAQLGFAGNMAFDGSWELRQVPDLVLRAELVRRSGDIRVLAEEDGAAAAGAGPLNRSIDAGVRQASLVLVANAELLRAELRWDSERAGQARAEFSTRLALVDGAWSWPPDAPLSGSVSARLPQVGVWSLLAPPGWRMRGTLDAAATLSGSRGAPHWSGSLQADDLALRSVVQGIEFSGGRLRAGFEGERLDIAEFSLRGAGSSGGTLQATGFAAWQPDPSGKSPALARIRLELDAQAKALRLSARADRRLSVSGALQARLLDARLLLRGSLGADQALIVVPDESAPVLGADVVLRRATLPGRAADPQAQAAAQAASQAARGAAALAGTRVQTDVDLALDLGSDFRVRGRGIDTRLAGTLQLRHATLSAALPRLTGDVRTVGGSYRAYGQLLDIEQGVFRFTGAYDNPALDVLAIRPNLAQRVGVQISGSALQPRVRLFAEPDLPDADKLAWLVLGRSAANGGAESAVLQQAALALLGGDGQGISGGMADALGLDELSFRGAATATDGSASAATVTLGKRLSRDFYVAYEHSLSGTLGTISIFYDLSRRFTLRAQTGEHSAVDLLFTIPFD